MPARARTTLVSHLAARILEEISAGRVASGDHLSAQALADRYAVSRSPVALAFKDLASKGVLRHESRRGYFVAAGPANALHPVPAADDPVHSAYHALAEDRLEGRLPAVVSLNFLRDRYRLTSAQVQALVIQVLKEGWLERRAGYGLHLTDMLNSADALLQTYRFRMSIEPAALLEPGYHLDPQVAKACREVEEHMLAGGAETLSMEQLYERGVRFHEAIVAASGNPFFLDTLHRINGIRRLLAYRAAATRERYYAQARDHLEILDLLEAGRNEDAAARLRTHLEVVTSSLAGMRALLEPETRP